MPKIKLILISSISLLFFVFLFLVISYNLFLQRPLKVDYNFDIPSGTSKSQFIANFKSDQNLGMLSKTYLKIFYFFNPKLPFEAGSYNFSKGDSIKYVFTNIKGGVVQVPVTFLEGWRVEQNSIALAEKTDTDFAISYYQLAKDQVGYMFPDTYFISNTTTPQQLVDVQRQHFLDKTQDLFSNYTGDLTESEIIIMASIVEREALSTDDKNLIAGILVKRYLEGWPLDADATTQYGVVNLSNFPSCLTLKNCDKIEFWPKTLTQQQLKSTDPYNTRGVLGLPPAPISNPSINSIEAVINPKSSPYYFYLHDLKGNTYFAVSDEEHVANIQKYL